MDYLLGLDHVMMATEHQLRVADAFLASLTGEQIAEAQAALYAQEAEEDAIYSAARVRMKGSTAIVPIHGYISKRPNVLTYYGKGTSADLLAATFNMLAADDRVEHVVIDVDSGGGSVHGVEVATRALRELSKVKDTRSISNDINASAAYYISSAARRRFVTPSSITGSIGVLVIVPDNSEMWEHMGVKWHVVRSAEFKALLNGVEPVSTKALKEVEKGVNKFHADFVNAISRNLNISLDRAEKMADGKTHEGVDAIEVGLADAEATLDEILASIDAEDEQAEMFRTALAEAQAAIETLQSAKAGLEAEVEASQTRIADLEAEIAEVRGAIAKAEAEALVEAAIIDGKIPSQKRDKYVAMAIDKGVDFVADVFADIAPGAVVPMEDVNEARSTKAKEEMTEIEASVFAQFPSLRAQE